MTTDRLSLGDRMKRYEAVPKINLMRRNPVIIRVDGKAFHTFTRGFEKPWDSILVECMTAVAMKLVEGIQGADFAYVQSDEVSVLLTDYAKLWTDAWFDYSLQKMVSVSASIATAAFNAQFPKSIKRRIEEVDNGTNVSVKSLEELSDRVAMFDSRAFSVPRNEVVNYFIWRQQDCTRNSIQGLAQSMYSSNQIHGISCNGLQDLMFRERGVNWSDCDTWQKRGWCVRRNVVELNEEECPRVTSSVDVDWDIPEFKDNRGFIEQYVNIEEE